MKMREGMIGFRPCIYETPSGKQLEFAYSTAMEESFQHRTADFTFVGIDGAYIQDNGLTAREFPLELHLTRPTVQQVREYREALQGKRYRYFAAS